MAVLANNNDGTGSSSAGNVNTNSANGGNNTSNVAVGKNLNSNTDAISGVNIDKPGCSGSNILSTVSSSANSQTTDMVHDIENDGLIQSKPNDINKILILINNLEQRPMELKKMRAVYQFLILRLARVQMPPPSADGLKRFKEDIIQVGAFFRKAKEKQVYLLYLRVICNLITQSDDTEPPSCAVAIIFQLFSSEMIQESVESLLNKNIPDQTIRKIVRVLREWLRMCNFCQNLKLWIMTILNEIRDQQKYILYTEIAKENIESLFSSLIIPVLRPKVAPIVFHMLTTVTDTPVVFQKILNWFPKVINCLKQQSNSLEDHSEETKKFLQQLVDLVSGLMVRFHTYDDLYDPIERAIQDIPATCKFISFVSADTVYGSDVSNHNPKNAKVGLVNLGNTCYMNSVLQALVMTKGFCRQFLLSESKAPLVLNIQQQIALMLYSTRYELTPTRFFNAARPPSFTPGVQQDSSEFLGYLLEILHDQEILYFKNRNEKLSLNESYNSLISSEGAIALSGDSDNTEEKSKCEIINSRKNENSSINMMPKTGLSTSAELSAIEKTFSGTLATIFKCLTCGWNSRNVDSFRELQLAFPEVKNECAPNYSVQDLLEYYCSPEKLDGDNQYFCQRCKKLSDAERYINVIRAPKNLILTLKYFKYDQKYHMRAKLMHKVFHDEKVSLKVCSSETLEEISSVHYDLYAGVVHSGFSMDSGHYYTYASDSPNQWFKFNDSVVTLSKSEELHNLMPPNTPYILFYQMGARSNETDSPASTKVIKVDIPVSLTFDELPDNLREFVNHDNDIYVEEAQINRKKFSSNLKNSLRSNEEVENNRGNFGGNTRNYDDDDDDDQPPPASGGCGGNALNFNANRYVF